MLILTRRAIAAIELFMKTNDKAGFGVRIMAEAGGCSGPHYAMRLEAQPGDGDTIVEIRDVRVFLDQGSQTILTGATVDYSDAEDDHGFNFTLAQPVSGCTKSTAGQSCSCGRAPG
jgi:iron-sulfur cluster assembly accessory protein